MAVFCGVALLYLIPDLFLGILVVFLLFAMRGASCADDVNHAIDPREETGQQAFASRCAPYDHFPLFFLGMFRVIEVDRLTVCKNSGRFVEGNIVFFDIPHRFFCIPIKFEWFVFCHAQEYSIPIF